MRVLLVRLDGVGDAAVCAPLIAALVGAGHAVGAASSTRNAGLFAPGVLVAEHVLERIPWPAHGSTPQSTARALDEIAAQRYDAALIASEEPEAFALAAKVPERVGFTTGWSRPFKNLWVRRRVTRAIARSQRAGAATAHEAQVLFRLGAALVRESAPTRDRARLRPLFVAGAGADAEPPVDVLVQAGAKWGATGVDGTRLRALFAALAPHASFVAAPDDVEAVRAHTGVTPRTLPHLRAWVETVARARCIVSVDTGAAHVGGMLCDRVVDVFPDAGFAAQVRRWHPWAAPYAAFRASEVNAARDGPFLRAVLDGA